MTDVMAAVSVLGAGPLTHRPLESAHFGVPVHAATVTTPESLAAVLAQSATLDRALLVLRVPAEAQTVTRKIERAGGQLSDGLVTLVGTLTPRESASSRVPTARFRRGGPADADALLKMATAAFSGSTTHWHSDPRIAAPLADLLYGRWAADLARQDADATPLYIAEHRDGGIAGFLALAPLANGTGWSVPLTAVAATARRSGVLGALLDAAALASPRTAGTPPVLEYETQTSNVAALAAMARRGLVPLRARLTFHLWVGA